MRNSVLIFLWREFNKMNGPNESKILSEMSQIINHCSDPNQVIWKY